jgi:hypothetical protein
MQTAVKLVACALVLTFLLGGSVRADIIEYGDEDLLNTGAYPSDPKAGATLQGLAPNAITVATNSFSHSFPFSPSAGDYAGTDQIYVGSIQTAVHDGYAEAASRINGPQVITLDYSSLVAPGQHIATLTLGIASDDFQHPSFGQPFIASINGISDTALTNELDSLDDGGPRVQFFSIGIDPGALLSSNVLTLRIDEGGDGGDGWAIDFLTVGVTTQAVPEPASVVSLTIGALGLIGFGWRRKHRASPVPEPWDTYSQATDINAENAGGR